MAMTATSPRKKRPRTFSLSEDVMEALENYKRERKSDSLTAALEEIVRAWKMQHLSSKVTSYYDKLSDEEVAREKQWGKFSESQM